MFRFLHISPIKKANKNLHQTNSSHNDPLTAALIIKNEKKKKVASLSSQMGLSKYQLKQFQDETSNVMKLKKKKEPKHHYFAIDLSTAQEEEEKEEEECSASDKADRQEGDDNEDVKEEESLLSINFSS
jgi:hypothetical protein